MFQGGGVRGLAYAGVLSALPTEYQIMGVGGSSAGAIVAALIAVGKYNPRELANILRDPDLYRLVADTDSARTKRIIAASQEIWNFLKAPPKRRLFPGLRWKMDAAALLRKHKSLFPECVEIWNKYGMHNCDKLQTWLAKYLGNFKFEDIARNENGLEDLKIVASDLGQKEYFIYSRHRTPNEFVSHAVRASASIPIFFNPFPTSGGFQVDGGLLSNFPSFLFAQSKYPTIGFRLNDLTPPTKIDSAIAYLGALLHTMVEAHDKIREQPSDFVQYTIETPPEISAFRFDLSGSEADALYKSGRARAVDVDWAGGSSAKQIIQYVDPRPAKTLEFSLRQAKSLFDAYRQKELWVEKLKQVATFTLRIERDWSAVYEVVAEALVQGDKPMFISEFRALDVPNDNGVPVSLIDFPCTIDEILPDGSTRDLMRIPAFNTETTKGFVVFFVPPIRSEERRTVRKIFSVPKEFAKSLGAGASSEAGYSVDQLADDHELVLKFRVLVDTDISIGNPQGEFGGTLIPGKTEYVEGTERSYRVWECQLDAEKITGEKLYRVTLHPK